MHNIPQNNKKGKTIKMFIMEESKCRCEEITRTLK